MKRKATSETITPQCGDERKGLESELEGRLFNGLGNQSIGVRGRRG